MLFRSKGLKRNENRFFSITISPSQKELRHMATLADKGADELVKLGISDNRDEAKEWLMRDMLKKYTESVMDVYAANFNREGIKDRKDLVWYGKVEKNRYWKHSDKAVRHNSKLMTEINRLEKDGKLVEAQELREKLILESSLRKGGKDIPVSDMLPKSGQNYHVQIGRAHV